MMPNKVNAPAVKPFPEKPTDGIRLGRLLEKMDANDTELMQQYHVEIESWLQEIALLRSIKISAIWHYELALSLARELYVKKQKGAKIRLKNDEKLDLVLSWNELRETGLKHDAIAELLLKREKWNKKYHSNPMRHGYVEDPKEAIKQQYKRASKFIKSKIPLLAKNI